MQPNFLQTVKMSRKMIHAFYIERDMNVIINYLDPQQASWFGAAHDQILKTSEEIICFFQKQSALRLPFRFITEDYKLATTSSDSCIVTALLLLESTAKQTLPYRMMLRFSFCFQWKNNRFYVVHVHASMPDEKPTGDCSFLEVHNKLNRSPLQVDTRKMYQIMQTLMDTLPIGIKIMENMPKYPCSYINKNLLSFLGYDDETFLSATNGNAASIVCPADRENFYNDLSICFNNGSEYSTEYRALKHNGSLLRVLEWGKKINNPNGIDIINSVLIPLPDDEETVDDDMQRPLQTSATQNKTPLIPLHLFLDTALEILNNTPDEQMAICNVLELIAETLHIGRAYIALFHPQNANLYIRWQWNQSGVVPLTCKRPLPKEDVLAPFNKDETCIYDDITLLTASPMKTCSREFSIYAALRCLLRKNDEKIGILCIQDTESAHAWTQNEIALIQSCAKLLVNPVVHAAVK